MSNNKIVRLPASEQIPTIMKELQTAVDTLKEMGAGVSVFGSARIKPGHPYYELAQELGRRLAEAGVGAAEAARIEAVDLAARGGLRGRRCR